MAASNSDTSAHQKGAWLLLNVASNTRLIREAIATGRGVALHHRLTDIKRPLELPRLLRLPSGLPGGVTRVGGVYGNLSDSETSGRPRRPAHRAERRTNILRETTFRRFRG
jgi:hypothetical protein